MALQSMTQVSRSTRSATTTSKLLISRQTNRDRTMLVFYIGSDICKQCRIQKGDKLDVMWDSETGDGLILKDKEGKTVTILDGGRGVLNFTWKKGMPLPPEDNGPIEAEDVHAEADDEEIHFKFPLNCA